MVSHGKGNGPEARNKTEDEMNGTITTHFGKEIRVEDGKFHCDHCGAQKHYSELNAFYEMCNGCLDEMAEEEEGEYDGDGYE